ncbi:unnamed protein product [Amoebophrya sp. A120]|nr:unnamed protein product [Amoebophrya sp. A120]|eukprot:GSA120T00010574001.1
MRLLSLLTPIFCDLSVTPWSSSGFGVHAAKFFGKVPPAVGGTKDDDLRTEQDDVETISTRSSFSRAESSPSAVAASGGGQYAARLGGLLEHADAQIEHEEVDQHSFHEHEWFLGDEDEEFCADDVLVRPHARRNRQRQQEHQIGDGINDDFDPRNNGAEVDADAGEEGLDNHGRSYDSDDESTTASYSDDEDETPPPVGRVQEESDTEEERWRIEQQLQLLQPAGFALRMPEPPIRLREREEALQLPGRNHLSLDFIGVEGAGAGKDVLTSHHLPYKDKEITKFLSPVVPCINMIEAGEVEPAPVRLLHDEALNKTTFDLQPPSSSLLTRRHVLSHQARGTSPLEVQQGELDDQDVVPFDYKKLFLPLRSPHLVLDEQAEKKTQIAVDQGCWANLPEAPLMTPRLTPEQLRTLPASYKNSVPMRLEPETENGRPVRSALYPEELLSQDGGRESASKWEVGPASLRLPRAPKRTRRASSSISKSRSPSPLKTYMGEPLAPRPSPKKRRQTAVRSLVKGNVQVLPGWSSTLG